MPVTNTKKLNATFFRVRRLAAPFALSVRARKVFNFFLDPHADPDRNQNPIAFKLQFLYNSLTILQDSSVIYCVILLTRRQTNKRRVSRNFLPEMKSELMFTRRATAYSRFCLQVDPSLAALTQFTLKCAPQPKIAIKSLKPFNLETQSIKVIDVSAH